MKKFLVILFFPFMILIAGPNEQPIGRDYTSSTLVDEKQFSCGSQSGFTKPSDPLLGGDTFPFRWIFGPSVAGEFPFDEGSQCIDHVKIALDCRNQIFNINDCEDAGTVLVPPANIETNPNAFEVNCEDVVEGDEDDWDVLFEADPESGLDNVLVFTPEEPLCLRAFSVCTLDINITVVDSLPNTLPEKVNLVSAYQGRCIFNLGAGGIWNAGIQITNNQPTTTDREDPSSQTPGLKNPLSR